MDKLCDYGCGQKARFEITSGKVCCSKYFSSCPELKRINSLSHKGKKIHSRKSNPCSEDTKRKLSEIFKGKKLSLDHREKLSNSHKGKPSPRKGKKASPELRKKLSDAHRGKTYEMLFTKEKSDEIKQKARNRMLDGHAGYMNKFIKNPSKPEVKLREIVKELYPNCEFQYQVFNYSLDIAIPDKKIAIEYDGYYHFDCEDNIKYHSRRQSKIEKCGWKFIRYTIFEPFPTIEQLKYSINSVLEE